MDDLCKSEIKKLKAKINMLEEELEQTKYRLIVGAPTDGLEVGNPEDYGDSPLIYESPDGGKTIYQRKFNDYNKRKKIEGEN